MSDKISGRNPEPPPGVRSLTEQTGTSELVAYRISLSKETIEVRLPSARSLLHVVDGIIGPAEPVVQVQRIV